MVRQLPENDKALPKGEESFAGRQSVVIRELLAINAR